MIKKKEGFAGQRSCVLPNDLKKQVAVHPLCESLYITDIGYYPKAAFHDRERRKGSPQHILIYCVQGEGWYFLNDRRYSVKPNQMFILPADLAHRYGTDVRNPWTIYWLHFTGSRAHHFLDFLRSSQDGSKLDGPRLDGPRPDSPGVDNSETDFAPITVSPQPERFQLFDDILAHVEMSFNLDNVIYANSSLSRFLATFNNAVYNPSPLARPESDPISQTITFMKENLSKSLSLEELAQVAGMSPSHYSAVFRAKVQSAPINFFTFLKIQEACRLLENTHYRIKEVAYQIGYSDPYHFSRVFSHVMGISPREFRQRRKA